jgi:hypothetical protein
MNPGQLRTLKLLAIWAALAFLLLVGLLVIELTGASAHSEATISELAWILWANHPWVIFIITHIIAAPTWFLLGHFVAQAPEVYRRRQ